MQRTILAAATVVATIALAACNSEPEAITVNKYDPQAEALANAAPVAPPPMIQASRTFRCRDNSLIYVDFYTDNTANLRTSQDGERIALTAEGGNPPFTGSGYSVSANADSITYTAPGGASLSCRV